MWLVVFDGEEAQFKHEKGAEYVARLLAERGPFHALDLAAKASGNSPRSRVEGRGSSARGGMEPGSAEPKYQEIPNGNSRRLNPRRICGKEKTGKPRKGN